jgi:hypothetical protein
MLALPELPRAGHEARRHVPAAGIQAAGTRLSNSFSSTLYHFSPSFSSVGRSRGVSTPWVPKRWRGKACAAIEMRGSCLQLWHSSQYVSVVRDQGLSLGMEERRNMSAPFNGLLPERDYLEFL